MVFIRFKCICINGKYYPKRGYVQKKNKDPVEINLKNFKLDNTKKIKEKTIKQKTDGEKNKLFPTEIGITVNNFLSDKFTNIMNFSFTKTLEEDFDLIANGTKKWKDIVSNVYNTFNPIVIKLIEDKDAEKIKTKRLVFTSQDNKKVHVIINKFGDPTIQEGYGKGVKFYSLPKDTDIEKITKDEVVEYMFIQKN